MQARGREGEHGWLKVFGGKVIGKVTGEKGGRLRGAGCGWLWSNCVNWGCGEDLGFILQQLSHKAKVGGDDGTALFDDVEGSVKSQPLGPHDVGHADSRGA